MEQHNKWVSRKFSAAVGLTILVTLLFAVPLTWTAFGAVQWVLIAGEQWVAFLSMIWGAFFASNVAAKFSPVEKKQNGFEEEAM